MPLRRSATLVFRAQASSRSWSAELSPLAGLVANPFAPGCVSQARRAAVTGPWGLRLAWAFRSSEARLRTSLLLDSSRDVLSKLAMAS